MCSHRMLIGSLAIEGGYGKSQNPPKSRYVMNFHVFHGFDRAKPLQTFQTWAAVRVRRSVRVLRHYWCWDMPKTKKIKQKTNEKRIQKQAKSYLITAATGASSPVLPLPGVLTVPPPTSCLPSQKRRQTAILIREQEFPYVGLR